MALLWWRRGLFHFILKFRLEEGLRGRLRARGLLLLLLLRRALLVALGFAHCFIQRRELQAIFAARASSG